MTRWRGRLRRSTVLLIPVLLTSGLLASGCGIAGEPRPRQVEPPPGNYDELIEQPPAPPTEERGGVEVTLYFTRDSVPYAVQRPMETTPSLGELMTSLHRGPTETEQGEGIISALPGAQITEQVDLDGGLARVGLTVSPDGTSRTDIILAFAQVVCTLDARPEVTGVSFVVQGDPEQVPVGVPTGDASALDVGPVTSADYGCEQPAE